MHPFTSRWFLGFICIFGLGCGEPLAQDTPPSAPPPPESRQFDFWLGEWEVTGPDGKPAGASRVQSIANGRALLENWERADGSSGKSINVDNAAGKRWQQFWVANSDGVLELTGGFGDGKMGLGNSVKRTGDRMMLNRIIWTPSADGSVRQLWEQSVDAGRTWQTVFAGTCRRRAKERPASIWVVNTACSNPELFYQENSGFAAFRMTC